MNLYRECTAGKGNERVCYGRNHKDRGDVMGIGHVVTKLHADPWVGSVADHTFTHFLDWTVGISTYTKEKYTL